MCYNVGVSKKAITLIENICRDSDQFIPAKLADASRLNIVVHKKLIGTDINPATVCPALAQQTDIMLPHKKTFLCQILMGLKYLKYFFVLSLIFESK